MNVPAQSKVTFTATITPATGPLKGVYGGYIVLTPQGGAGQTYRVPFAGFIGDYQSIVAATPTANGFPWVSRLVACNPVLVRGLQCFDPAADYDNAPSAPGNTFTMADAFNVPQLLVHLDHQARRMKVEVRHATTGQDVAPRVRPRAPGEELRLGELLRLPVQRSDDRRERDDDVHGSGRDLRLQDHHRQGRRVELEPRAHGDPDDDAVHDRPPVAAIARGETRRGAGSSRPLVRSCADPGWTPLGCASRMPAVRRETAAAAAVRATTGEGRTTTGSESARGRACTCAGLGRDPRSSPSRWSVVRGRRRLRRPPTSV